MQREFDVALSFAGEDRRQAKELADLLKSGGYESFYDEYERAYLWGQDLYVRLSSVYKDKAHYCVVFLSQHYANKLWTKHELKSAQARAFEENREYILPVRLDDTEIEGLLPTVGYLDLREVSIEEVYQALVQKLSGTLQTPVAIATSISTKGVSTNHCCRNCHFLAKYALTDRGQEHKWTWDAKERSDLEAKDHYGVECAKGIWSAGIDPEINSRLEEELLKDRKGECFFFEFDEARSSMTFDAATELLQLKRAESLRLQRAVQPSRQVAKPQLTSTESDVEKLKRFLAEPRYRIQLADLINETVERVIEGTSGNDFDANHPHPNTETVTARIRAYESACSTLIEMAMVGGRWAEEEHCDIWQRALQSLSIVPRPGGKVLWLDMRRYPAALLLYALGLGAVYADRLNFVSRLFSTTVHQHYDETMPAVLLLAPSRLFHNRQEMRILEGKERKYLPLNDWMEGTMRKYIKSLTLDDDQYTLIFDKFEILMSLNSAHHAKSNLAWSGAVGTFMYRYKTSWDHILPEIEGSILSFGDDSPYVKANLFGMNAQTCKQHLSAWYAWLSRLGDPGVTPFSGHPDWGRRVVNTVPFGNIRVGDPNQLSG